jgi:methionyl aminopeptidase
MDEDIYKKYKLAGKIAAEARDYGKTLIKSNVSLLDVANKVESKIINAEAGIAFPVNISINDVAAHYSPYVGDTKKFKKGDIVKLDVGAHIDGYIADTALTVEVGTNNHTDMIKASSEALDAAIDYLGPNVELSKVGKQISEVISSYGFKPISNLTGHGLEKYNLHSGLSVPNVVDMLNRSKTKLDNVIAVEPFATDGAGHVIAGKGSNIFICQDSVRSKFVRDKKYKLTYNKIKKQFNTLPFAQRWTDSIIKDTNLVLRKLTFLGLLKHFPQLIEQKHGIVSQKEHTLIITEDGCEVTT